MDQEEKDAGTISALMIRMTKSRLPRAHRLLEKVNDGSKLSDSDIEFLNRVFDDSRSNQSLFTRNPEFGELMSRFIDLYSEIVTKAFDNEKPG